MRSGTPDQLCVALLLGGPPRHAGNLEGVRVVAQHQQLVAAAKRHAGGHVKVPAHVAAGVVSLMLLLVNLQQDVAPRGRQGKVRVGVRRLRLQPAATEGQVVLVLKGDLRVAERLVHLELLTLGHRARVVAVRSSHMLQQAPRSGEWEILPRTALDLTHKIAAVTTPAPLSPMLAHADGPAAVATPVPQPRMLADRRAAAVTAPLPQSAMLADRRAAAVTALSPLSSMLADRRRRSHGTAAAAARAGTSSQAGAQVASLNTLSVFSHVPASGDANERTRIEAAVWL